MIGCGYGGGLGYLGALIPIVFTIWFVVFSIMVINKLDKIIELLSKK